MTVAVRPDFTQETIDRLQRLVAAVERWNPAVNLVSRESLPFAWTRHVMDSLQLLDHVPSDARLWADLGSGGGFPGLVVAIAAAERRPDMQVILIESDQRKAAFLREAARLVGVQVTLEVRRVEEVPPLGADVVSARALAALGELWPMALRHLSARGVGLFLKGKNHVAELHDAAARHRIRATVHPSTTSPDGVVLEVRAHG